MEGGREVSLAIEEVDEPCGEHDTQAAEGVVEHLEVGRVNARADAGCQHEVVDKSAGFQAAVQPPYHQGKKADDQHFGFMAGVDEGEQCGRRGVSDTREPGGDRFQTKPADTEVHKIAGHEHGEEVTPTEKTVLGCKQGDDFEWEVLGRPLSGYGRAAEIPRPVGGGQVGQFFQERLPVPCESPFPCPVRG